MPGSGDGELTQPWGIEIDGSGDVYLADWGNDRVQKFTADGWFLMKLGGPGSGDGELDQPTGVAVDRNGLIYVADWGNDRLQVFGADGNFVTKFTGDGTISQWGKETLDSNPVLWEERKRAFALEREKLFWGPIAVDVDSEARVSVVESARHRIQVYCKLNLLYFGGSL